MTGLGSPGELVRAWIGIAYPQRRELFLELRQRFLLELADTFAAHRQLPSDRLERLLEDLRANASTARETEAIREIGLEIAIAVREVGAMLVNVGWEQSYATKPTPADA